MVELFKTQECSKLIQQSKNQIYVEDVQNLCSNTMEIHLTTSGVQIVYANILQKIKRILIKRLPVNMEQVSLQLIF